MAQQVYTEMTEDGRSVITRWSYVTDTVSYDAGTNTYYNANTTPNPSNPNPTPTATQTATQTPTQTATATATQTPTQLTIGETLRQLYGIGGFGSPEPDTMADNTLAVASSESTGAANKNLLIVVVLVLIAGAGYYLWSR